MKKKAAAKKAAPDSDWKAGFLFLGNQLALDFINTRPVQNGEAVELLPDFEALLRWFQAAGLLSAAETAGIRQRWRGSARARRMAGAVRELREKLRMAVGAWKAGNEVPRAIVPELNRLIAEHPMLTRLIATASGLERQEWFETQRPEDLFAPLAEGAAALFTGVSRDRVRKCAECVLHFQDTSKKGTRRWCSMRLCGNRLKVAAYASRKRVV